MSDVKEVERKKKKLFALVWIEMTLKKKLENKSEKPEIIFLLENTILEILVTVEDVD